MCKALHPRANTSLHTLRLPYTHTRVQNRSTCKDILAHLHYNTSVQDHTSPCKYPLAHYVQKAPCTLTPMCTHLHTLTHASSHAQAHPCVQPCAFAHPRANTTLHTPMCASLVHYAPSFHSPRPHARVQIDHYTFDMHPCATSLAHSCANSALATPISRCVQPRCAMFCTLTRVQMRVHSCTPTCKTSLCIPTQPFLAHACAQIHTLVQQPRVQNPTATCKGLHSHCGALAQV